MHQQIYGNHSDDPASSSTFSLNNAVSSTTSSTNSTNNNNNNNISANNNSNGQDGSTIESNHSSPIWPIPSTSSSSLVLPGNPSNTADLFSTEPYSVAAMAVSRYTDDLYMNCYSSKMNSLLFAQAATTKLNDPTNGYNRKRISNNNNNSMISNIR